MKTRLKKTLSVLLTLCMILSVMSSSLIAVGASESAEPVSNDTVISDTESADGADTVTMPEGMTEGDPQTPPSDEPAANTEGEDSLAPTDSADSTDPAAPEDESDADTPADEGIGMPGEEQNEDDVNNDVQAGENDDPSYDDPSYDEGEGENGGVATLANEQNKSSNLSEHHFGNATVKDEYGNTIWSSKTGKVDGHLVDGQTYIIEYTFYQTQVNHFGGASAQELQNLGIPEPYCNEEGRYLYYKLDPNISFDIPDDFIAQAGYGAIVVKGNDGIYILYDYNGIDDWCTVGFKSVYHENKTVDNTVKVYEDDVTGSFTNDYIYPPAIDKKLTAYNLEDKTVSYTITVSNRQNATSIQINSITDTLKSNNVDKNLKLNNLKILKQLGNQELLASDYTYNDATGVISFNSSEAGTLEANQYFEITYTMNVDSLFDNATSIVNLNNSVTVNYDNEKTVTGSSSKSVSEGSIQKTGNVVEEGGVKYVKWEIYVHSPVYQKDGINHNSLNGVIIEDLLTSQGLTIDEGKTFDSSGKIPVYKDKGYNLSNGINTEVTGKETGDLTITLHADDSCGEENAYLYLYTKYEEGKTYKNYVTGTFPDEGNKKEESHSGEVSDSGSGSSGGTTTGFGVVKHAPKKTGDILTYTVDIKKCTG